MDKALFGINNFDVYAVLSILVIFSTIEIFGGLLRNTKRESRDWWLEVGSFFALSILIKPLLIFLVFAIGNTFFPSAQFSLAGSSFLLLFFTYLLIDDVLQYWYHRSAHEYEWLWKLHRPHHLAEEMGLLVSYRNAALYYLLMPNIWWVGIMTFLGGAKAVALGLILKQLVIIGSHSPTKWDQFLYKYKFLSPLAFIIERIFITPAFHFAHHGKTQADGISEPNGNYGNMFSIWDQLFGTALFTRKYPAELGLLKNTKDSFAANYFYPIIKSNQPGSEIAPGFQKTSQATAEPDLIELKPGKYAWCQCGFSSNQPFCDGSHHGSKNRPIVFDVKKKTKLRLCNCKLTKKGPFCDDSHVDFKSDD